MRLLRHLPNALTSLNLLCGVVGIVWLIDLRTGSDLAFWIVLLACFFDFLDGFAARILKVSSPIGKELDSLADMVTFGVYPSLVMMLAIRDAGAPNEWLQYVALLLAVCSALRLAKFNIDEKTLADPCINTHIGAWVLAHNIARLGLSWDAVGAYNAKSPSKRLVYAHKVARVLEKQAAKKQPPQFQGVASTAPDKQQKRGSS